MATIKKITEDLKNVHSLVKSIVKKALAENIKDGQSVFLKSWSPKKGWHWQKQKFNYYHKVHGLYPNVNDKIGAVGSFAQNNYVIKKNSKSKEITF